jgi:hypothetical protein
VLYLCWGGFLWMAAQGNQSFKFAWGAALDPLGWLYGATIIAIRAGINANRPKYPDASGWSIWCFLAAAACFLALAAGMQARGLSGDWRAPRRLNFFAAFMAVAILALGWKVCCLNQGGT